MFHIDYIDYSFVRPSYPNNYSWIEGADKTKTCLRIVCPLSQSAQANTLNRNNICIIG